MDIAKFRQLPVMGIVRGIDPQVLEPLIAGVQSAGLKTLEITMNTKGASDLIRRAVKVSAQKLTIGAGTVLNLDSMHSALDAGATFIVLPVLVREVVEYCVKKNIPVFPGALTPQEIYAAWAAGASMVKVFPAGFFGPAYFKEIKGPFADIQLLACGGVTPENMKEYFKSGASAVCFGASVFRQDWLLSGDFASIKQRIASYLQQIPS